MAKIEMRGAKARGCQYCYYYCIKRKMLEETETEEKIGIFVKFLSLAAFHLERGSGPPAPSLPVYAYDRLPVLYRHLVCLTNLWSQYYYVWYFKINPLDPGCMTVSLLQRKSSCTRFNG